MKWETVPFGDLFAEKTRNGVYKPADFHGSGVKIVNMGELFAAGKIGSQRMERVELSESERHVSLLRENDLLFARRSLVESGAGKVSIVHGLTEETTFESSIIRVRLNTELCNPLFYYYWLSSFPGRAVILPLITGLNVKGIRGSELTGIKVSYPPLNIQNRISDILSAYDNLIENNQKQIKLLEEAAQRLYKEWFIDLRFPGYESTPIHDGIPEGWEIVPLESVLQKLTTGLNPRKNFVLGQGNNYYVTIKNMGDNTIFLDDKCDRIDDEAVKKINARSDLREGDILFSGIGTIGRVYLVCIPPINWNVSESVFTLRANSRTTKEYLYLVLLSNEMQSYCDKHAHGVAQRGIRMADLKAFPFLLPSLEIQEKFEKIVKPIISGTQSLHKQTRVLSEARDRLLPKLMSGEIEV